METCLIRFNSLSDFTVVPRLISFKGTPPPPLPPSPAEAAVAPPAASPPYPPAPRSQTPLRHLKLLPPPPLPLPPPAARRTMAWRPSFPGIRGNCSRDPRPPRPHRLHHRRCRERRVVSAPSRRLPAPVSRRWIGSSCCCRSSCPAGGLGFGKVGVAFGVSGCALTQLM